MSENQDNLESVESAMLELDEARHAGVFNRTPVDVETLIGSKPKTSNPPLWLTRPLPIAASIALAACVWGVMFQYQLDAVRNGNAGVSMVTEDRSTETLAFVACVERPIDVVAFECNTHDFDADGDVDLADFSRYQLAFAAPSRTR